MEITNKKGQGKQIASLIMGIAGIVIFPCSIMLGPLALIFGAITLKEKPNGLAIAGFILGIIGSIIGLVMLPFLVEYSLTY